MFEPVVGSNMHMNTNHLACVISICLLNAVLPSVSTVQNSTFELKDGLLALPLQEDNRS